MHPITKNNILYYESVSAYPNDHRAVKWASAESQFTRFKILCEIAPDLLQSRLLDVGCGLGHLVDYLISQQFTGTYKGIDLVDQMIINARKRHPAYDFETNDIDAIELNHYDYVLASGIFTFIDWEMAQAIIMALSARAIRGVAFNCLSDGVLKQDRENEIFYYNPTQVLEFCKKIAPNVILREGYLDNDFTIYVTHR